MKRVFDKTIINGMTLKNRFIRTGLWMKSVDDDGSINDETLNIYRELGVGGAGLIITGYANASSVDIPNIKMINASNDNFIEGLRNLASAIKEGGSMAGLQISPGGGSQNFHPNSSEQDLVGPSEIENRVTKITPRKATKEDLARIIDETSEAARRGKEAGFDAIELHLGHGYLVSQFLTPYYNRRNDEYGGDIHNRARLIYEIIEATRTKLGSDYPILIKINHNDLMDDGEGLELEDAIKMLEKIDTLDVDIITITGVNESSGKGLAPALKGINKLEDLSYFKEATIKIANKVKTKICLMGGNKNIDLMEGILNSSNIDYLAEGRPLLAEPDLINKWGKDKAYKPKCIACNKCWETTPCSCIFNR